MEKRANYYTDSNSANGLTRQIAKGLCEGFKCSDAASLLNFTAKSYENASPAERKFPLIIYLCAYNGMSFENYTLFEKLAAKGFVVISISSIGRHPGDMTMKSADLMQQVDDAIASVNLLKENSNIDFSKIGIIGYSWGGLAAAVAATKNSNVKCLVSLDGSEFHHYGEAKDENREFDGTRYGPDFANMHLSMPYLRFERLPFTKPDNEDSVYNFSGKLASENMIFKIDSTQLEDFSCLPVVVRESGNCDTCQYYNTITKLVISFMEDHLKRGSSFASVVNGEMNKTIRRK
ncbi:MAG: alpha/beta fold hydrolase [Ginsengibacter sp.]